MNVLFRFISKHLNYCLIKKSSELSPEKADYEIIKYLIDNKFDYQRETFVPSDIDKLNLFQLFENKINNNILLRDMNMVEALKNEKWPIKHITWQGKEIELLHTSLDLKLINDIEHYYAFYNSYQDKSNIYIDYIDSSFIGYDESDKEVYHIINLLVNNKKIKITNIIKSGTMSEKDIIEFLNTYKKFGIIFFLTKTSVSLTDRGKRLLISPEPNKDK